MMYALRYEQIHMGVESHTRRRRKDLRVTPKQPHKTPPTRYRLSVPVADEAVNEWLGFQDNMSASVRAVIREHIERNGLVDPTCRPVSQQARRGRPPASETDPDAIDFSASQGSQEGPQDDDETGLGMKLAQVTGRAAEGRAQEAAAAAENESNDASGSGPESMDDIFSTGRNR